jgi:hypothetical protein
MKQAYKRTRNDWLGVMFGAVVVLPCAASILLGASTIVWQCLNWLKTATWQTLTLRDGLSSSIGPWWLYYSPQTGYLGLDKVLTWSLDNSPLGLWPIVIAPIVWLILGVFLFNLLSPTYKRAE